MKDFVVGSVKIGIIEINLSETVDIGHTKGKQEEMRGI